MSYNSSIQPQKPQLISIEKTLELFLQNKGALNGYLIVDKGIRKETHPLELLWGKFKNLIGVGSQANDYVIRQTINAYVDDHLEDVRTDHEVENIKGLAKEAGITPSNGNDPLINREGRMKFEEWLINHFSPKTATSAHFYWHSQVISLLCVKAWEDSISGNTQEEDLLLASLISKALPLSKKEPGFLRSTLDQAKRFVNYRAGKTLNLTQIFISLKDSNFPITRTVLLRRLIEHHPLGNLLRIAIHLNNSVMVRTALTQHPEGFKASMKINDGETLLHLATGKCSLEIVKLMAVAAPEEFKAAMKMQTKKGVTPLHNAAISGSLEIIKLMAAAAPEEFKAVMEMQTNEGATPLHDAAFSGSLETVKLMADAVPEEFKAAMKMITEHGNTPLHDAAISGSLEIVKLMADAAPEEFKAAMKMQLTGGGYTPLHYAVIYGSLEVIKLMADAAPEEFKSAVKTQAHRGDTPLDILKAKRIKNHKEISQIFKSNSELRESYKLGVNRKALAHAYHISGTSSLIDSNKKKHVGSIRLEAHQSAQWFQLMSKNLKQFHGNYPHSLNKSELSIIMQAMDLGANGESFSLEDKLQKIKEGRPMALATGFLKHSVTLLIWGNQFIICNRGGASKCPIKVYHFDPQLMDSEDLKKIEEVKIKSEEKYEELYFEILPKKLKFSQNDVDLALERTAPLPFQTVGNCSFVSPITSIYAVMLMMKMRRIDEEGHLNKEDSSDLDNTILSTHVKEVVSLYQTWLAHEQIAILERNVLPLKEGGLAFETDHSLILQALHKSYLLEMDEQCQNRLEALTEVYVNSEKDPHFQSEVKASVAYWKTLSKVPLLEIGFIQKPKLLDDLVKKYFFDAD